MASSTIQGLHWEDPLTQPPSESTELLVRHHSQEKKVGKVTSRQKAPTRSSTSQTTTPILTLPNEILYQICEDVFWYHVMLSEVDILRCASRRCFTEIDMQELKDRFVRPRQALLGDALKAPGFSWFKLYGRKPPIPLLLVCKRIQQVTQEVLYSYQVFHIHIHIQTPETKFSLQHGRLQTSNLSLCGHKLRNVMFLLYVNTATRGTAFFNSRDQFYRFDLADRYISFKDKVDDRKEQLSKAIELLLHQRQQNLIHISVKCSFTPALTPFSRVPLPKWKGKLVQNILQPLNRLKGWVAEVPEVPPETEPDRSRPASQAYQSDELDSFVDATVRRLLQ